MVHPEIYMLRDVSHREGDEAWKPEADSEG